MPCGTMLLAFFIIAVRMAAMPSVTKSVTSDACCWWAAMVSGSVDVWTTTMPFSVVSTVVSIFS